MLISKKWLQTYFDVELPSAQKIADTLLLHSFEIEGLFEVAGDWVIDIDVLPNRAHDCLCHEGVARELSVLLDLPIRDERYSDISVNSIDEQVSVAVLNFEQCRRYAAVLMKNIEVRESPEWLKSRLTSMGQKSINSLVDATNYIMFDMGQPMHVFDAERVVGGITVRNAELGETMKSLSGEDFELLETDLVICDNDGILALAGVKGGTRAEVTAETKNIIIESANFNPTTTRKTARRVKMFTDASKRYENEITSEKVLPGAHAMVSLVLEISGTDETVIGNLNGTYETDIYPNPETEFQLIFTREHTARLLGFDISDTDIKDILKKMNYQYVSDNESYTVLIPAERIDLRIPEDMIEEIGRIYGYHAIPVKSLGDISFSPEINKGFYASQLLRNYFTEKGFTEIMNYSFVNKGNVELFNPIASDKKALRKNLSKQMRESMDKNTRISDFVDVEQVMNFEIDIVHAEHGEELYCCFGIDTLSKKSRKKFGDEAGQIKNIVTEIESLCEIPKLDYVQDGGIVSFNVEQCFGAADNTYGDLLKNKTYSENAMFKGVSIYPYMKRDISFWAETGDVVTFNSAINNTGAQFLQKVSLFDEFEKDGKTSYAFSMIFQSFERTLTDSDVDSDMELINNAVEKLGGVIR